MPGPKRLPSRTVVPFHALEQRIAFEDEDENHVLQTANRTALLENVADAVNTRLFLPAGMFSEDAKNRWPFYLLSIVLG